MVKDQRKTRLYTYNGPVMEFDKCIVGYWKASTYAVSEAKARSNLAHNFRLASNKPLNAKITLPGKIIMEEE